MNTLAVILKIRSEWALIAALFCLTIITTYGQKAQLVMQAGHFGPIYSIAYSPDAKTIASASYDMTIKLWDVSTGTEFRTLKGHTAPVTSVVFSPDGKLLASASNDYVVKLWDVGTGTVIRTLREENKASTRTGGFDVQYSIAFSRDGKILAGGGGTGWVVLWDTATGTILRGLKGHANFVFAVAFSSDGTTLASGSYDGVIKLWNYATGELLRTLAGHTRAVSSVAFDPQGTTLASSSLDKTVILWDVATGTVLHNLTGNSAASSHVAFSGDGQALASAGDNFTIKIWNQATGLLERTLKTTQPALAVTFSSDPNDHETLASGSYDLKINLWNFKTGDAIRTLKGHSSQVNCVALSPDGKFLASGGWDSTVKLWDLTTGTLIRTLKGQTGLIWKVGFSPNGKMIASGADTVKVWNIETGEALMAIKSATSFSGPFAFSPDSKTIASGGKDNSVTLWDISSGTNVRTFAGHTDFVFSLAFSSDGKTLASGGHDNNVKLWNVSSGQELKTLKGHTDMIRSVAFRPDNKTLATAGEDKTIKLWDVVTGKLKHEIRGHSEAVFSLAFNSGGNTLASGSYDNAIKFWNVESGAEIRTFEGHAACVSAVVFGPNDKYLVSGSWDMSAKIWDVDSGKVLATLSAIDDADWIVVSPDGRFDGTPSSWDRMIWRFNNDTFDYAPVEAYFNEFYYPGLLKDIFDGRVPKAPADIVQRDRRQPKLTLRLAGSEQADATHPYAHALMRIVVTDAPAGAKDVRLFRNGFLIKVWHGDVMKGKDKVFLDASVPITAGSTQFTAYAFNKDDVKSRDAKMEITDPDAVARKGVAYVLSIGVNQYANSKFDLKYAVADAQAFAAELKAQQAKIANSDRSETVVLQDTNATKANILKAIADISAKILPEDSLTVYFAGHGTAQANRFYLIPHDIGYMGSRDDLDAAGLKTVLLHSISDEELRDALEAVDARQIILVIDACNSGQALEAEEKRRGPMNSKGLAQLAYEKGMYILTAAQSYQAANEATKLGHGFLTYALVEEGLKTNLADKEPKDGQVLLREWLDFATERVPLMQQSYETARQLRRDQGTKPADNVQRPRVFYRREADPHPMVIARPN